MRETSVVYDLMLLEADRIKDKRNKDLDLYHKNPQGDFVLIAEAYKQDVDDVINSIFKRRRMRYMMSFLDAMEVQEKLLPSAHKLLRYLSRIMTYGNTVKNMGLRDFQDETGINMRYIVKGIRQLCQHDIIRFQENKGRRSYIVNPLFFYKGTLRSIFKVVRSFETKYPKRDEDLNIITEKKEVLFDME